MERARIAAALVLMASIACRAQAYVCGPPFFTDDPEPVEYLHWEVYVASQYLHTHDDVSGTAPHFELNYGAAPNLQLHVIAPFAYSMPTGGSKQWGYGDTEFGMKYRFVQETKNTPQVGIFPLIEAPTGSASRGLGNGHAQYFLPVWIQKSFGDWTTYGGGGFWHNTAPGARDHWFFGWQAQKAVSKSLTLGGEVFYQTADTVGGNNHTGFNIGGIYDFNEGHHFLFSIGSDVAGSSLGTMYVAYQWTFGPREKKG